MSTLSTLEPPEKKALAHTLRPAEKIVHSFASTLIGGLQASPELHILQSQERRDSEAHTLRLKKRDSHRWELGRELPECDRARITRCKHIISD